MLVFSVYPRPVQFDDCVDEDFVVAPRPVRPVLLDLSALETCVIETLPAKVAHIREQFDVASAVRVVLLPLLLLLLVGAFAAENLCYQPSSMSRCVTMWCHPARYSCP
jgi:hypothetical protein